MSEVKRWLEEVWEVEDVLGEAHPFERIHVEAMAFERLQATMEGSQGEGEFGHLRMLNDYLAGLQSLPR